VAIADEDIAVAVDQMDAVPALADARARHGKLHRAVGLDGVGFFVGANELDTIDARHALVLPDLFLKTFRAGRALGMRADEPQRRPGSGHYNLADAMSLESDITSFIEIDRERPRNAKASLGNADDTSLGLDRLEKGLGIIGLAVADRAVVAQVSGSRIAPLLLLSKSGNRRQ
jgi:hypothetical protein